MPDILTLDLFAVGPLPLDLEALETQAAAMRVATERSQSVREDLMLPVPLHCALCGLCAESASLPEGWFEATDSHPLCCASCYAQRVSREEGCPFCDGEGTLTDFEPETCDICLGTGNLSREEFEAISHDLDVQKALDGWALKRLEARWPDVYAFVAQARRHGHTDPSLEPVRTDTAGRRTFDTREVARFANELLCGVRSDRPEMTPERWRDAIAKAREGVGP